MADGEISFEDLQPQAVPVQQVPPAAEISFENALDLAPAGPPAKKTSEPAADSGPFPEINKFFLHTAKAVSAARDALFPDDGGKLWDARRMRAEHWPGVKGAVKVVAGGVVDLGELAGSGLVGLVTAASDPKNTGAFTSGMEGAQQAFHQLNETARRITGVNLAPQNQQEQAMADLLAVIPEGVTAVGD